MSELDNYHGYYSADEYTRGESTYRWLKEEQKRNNLIAIEFLIPVSLDDHYDFARIVGPLNRVYRESNVPFAELAFANHVIYPNFSSVPKAYEPEDGIYDWQSVVLGKSKPDFESHDESLEAMINAYVDYFQRIREFGRAGLLFSDKPIQINLSVNEVYGIELMNLGYLQTSSSN